jgi:hypothetical protein
MSNDFDNGTTLLLLKKFYLCKSIFTFSLHRVRDRGISHRVGSYSLARTRPARLEGVATATIGYFRGL